MSEEAIATQCDDLDGTDTDDDDVTSPARSVGVWGTLIDASGTLPPFEMSAGPYTIGRAESCALRLFQPRVSSIHARISRDGDSAVIEDCSTNGSFVNGQKVGKGRLRVLADGDDVAFIAPGAPAVAATDASACTFVFRHAAAAAPTAAGDAAATPTDPSPAAASSSAAAAPSADVGGVEDLVADPPAASTVGSITTSAPATTSSAQATCVSTDPANPANPATGPAVASAASAAGSGSNPSDLEKELVCGVCHDLMHRPVALQPCMHSFCGGCFAEWMRHKAVCPQCRQLVRVVRPHRVTAAGERSNLRTRVPPASPPAVTARVARSPCPQRTLPAPPCAAVPCQGPPAPGWRPRSIRASRRRSRAITRSPISWRATSRRTRTSGGRRVSWRGLIRRTLSARSRSRFAGRSHAIGAQ